MLNKHKLFLLCAKWILVVTAIGILVTNTIAYYGCNDIVVDIFNFNIGTSVAGVILMYVCSYAFNFCIWHKLVITYNALIIAIIFIIRYCITEVGSHKDYASKGVAGAGLGLGIAGTALWLLSGGLGGGLFGNRFGAAGAAALGAESTVEKEDKCELVNGMWQLAFNGQTARFNDRNQINAEMFGIYKSQVDADFGLYKSTRDSFDITNARVGELEKQVAVLIATRPYQDALIQSDIRRVAEHADFNLFRRTCRMITGELVLPNTPTVTGYPSYNPCRVDNSTSTPAA